MSGSVLRNRPSRELTALGGARWKPVDRAGALLTGFFTSRIGLLAQLTVEHSVRALYFSPGFAEAGGLISHQPCRQVRVYTGKIVRGEKPADLPVVQRTKFEFVINL